MKIYNTLTRKKEEFQPLEEGKVKMYVCGPTVYNLIHIGNARPMICFDTVEDIWNIRDMMSITYLTLRMSMIRLSKRPMKKVYLPKKFHSVISQSVKRTWRA